MKCGFNFSKLIHLLPICFVMLFPITNQFTNGFLINKGNPSSATASSFGATAPYANALLFGSMAPPQVMFPPPFLPVPQQQQFIRQQMMLNQQIQLQLQGGIASNNENLPQETASSSTVPLRNSTNRDPALRDRTNMDPALEPRRPMKRKKVMSYCSSVSL